MHKNYIHFEYFNFASLNKYCIKRSQSSNNKQQLSIIPNEPSSSSGINNLQELVPNNYNNEILSVTSSDSEESNYNTVKDSSQDEDTLISPPAPQKIKLIQNYTAKIKIILMIHNYIYLKIYKKEI